MSEYRHYATVCIDRLLQWYNPEIGLWENAGWWNNANILEAVIDYASLTRTDQYDHTITTTFEKGKVPSQKNNWKKNFDGKYYDDRLWWALTWIKAYDLTRKKDYLLMAKEIFVDTSYACDTDCGGGVWWSRTHDQWHQDISYKNAITNELFLTTAARLSLRIGNSEYLYKWAIPAWKWLQTSGLLSTQGLVHDRLNYDCTLGDTTTWTYNQGVILGGLSDLYRSTRDVVYLQKAQTIAHAALVFLIDEQGILKEPVERDVNDTDAPQFKGIFIRNLTYLAQTLTLAYGLTSAVAEPYKQFIRRNVTAMWENRTPQNEFGYHWNKLCDKADAARQGSALDAFNAALFMLGS
jgi:predicted alpha-1,6-mannanase (GH76 family)